MALSFLILVSQKTRSRFQHAFEPVLLQLFIQMLVDWLEFIVVTKRILAHFVFDASRTIDLFTAGTLLRFPDYKFATQTDKDFINSRHTTFFFQWINLDLNFFFNIGFNRWELLLEPFLINRKLVLIWLILIFLSWSFSKHKLTSNY